MPKRADGLTSRQVTTEKRPGLYADGGNLYLQVTPGGSRTWSFRFQICGRRREMGLGPVADTRLAEARRIARDLRVLVRDGIDPIERRSTRRDAAGLGNARAMTFRQCAEAYIESHRAGWGNAKHAGQWVATMVDYVYPVIGELPVRAIDTGLVMKTLTPIWATKTTTASRVRGRIELVLAWANHRRTSEG